MHNCPFKNPKLKKEKINIARYWGKELVALNDVPALICQKCGERYFEAKVSHKIDEKIQLVLSKKLSSEKINIPIVNF